MVPAGNITIISSGVGSLDYLLSATNGTINVTDPPMGGAASDDGTLSVAALETVGAAIPISITAGQSITFTNGTSADLLTSATNSAQFIAVNGSVTFNPTAASVTTAGGNLVFVAGAAGGSITLGSVASHRGASGAGNITLVADAVSLDNGSADAGATGIATIRPNTNNTQVDLGTETGGKLSLTDAELDNITAGTLRVGDSNTGAITISAPITLAPASVPTLSLTSAAAVNESAGSLTVDNLAVQGTSASLTNSNDVQKLAGASSAGNFLYTDANGFQIDSVDGATGISATTRIDLTSGGNVTQAAGAKVTTPSGLRLLGTGSYALNEPTNNVATIAANLTGSGNALSYTDADALSVGSVSATDGVTTNNGAITLATVNGPLTVTDAAAGNDVDAGSSTVSLTAGSTGNADNALAISMGAAVSGSGGVTLTADNMSIGGTVNAGTNTATLQPSQSGTAIDLGGSDGSGTLGLTNPELNNVTAGTIVVGSSTAGSIAVTAAINPAGTSQLELVTSGQVIDDNTSNPDITVTRLAITAGIGIGVSATDPDAPPAALETSVSNLEATTATGGISIANSGAALTIGNVNATLSGVTVTGASGDILITNNDDIFIDQPDEIVSGPGDITIQTTSGGNITTGGSNEAVSSTGGTVSLDASGNLFLGDGNGYGDVQGGGSVVLNAGGDIVIDADTFVDAHGTGTVVATAGGNISILQVIESGSRITTEGGTITLTTGPNYTLTVDSDDSGAIRTTENDSTGGAININADRVDITLDDSIDAGTAIVTIQQVSPAWAINLGSTVDTTASTLELSDAELDRIVAGVLRIGDPNNTGSITVSQAISPANVPVLTLLTNGAIIDGNATGNDITIASLALKAATGIGSADPLETAVTNLAALNTTSGTISIANTTNSPATALNVTTVDGVVGIVNQNAVMAAGGIFLSTDRDLDIQQNVTAAGENTVELDAGGKVTLESGTTVQSGNNTTGGAIYINANVGNSSGTAGIILKDHSSVLTVGTVNLTTRQLFGAAGGPITMDPTAVIAGPSGSKAGFVSLYAGQDITLSTITSSLDIYVETATNILDDQVEGTSVSADGDLSLTAGGRIGGATQISLADVLAAIMGNPTAAFMAALDVDFGGRLDLQQTGLLGNVQVRDTSGGLNTSRVTITGANFVGNGNQLSLISSGGNLNFDSGVLTVPGNNNANALLATTGGNDIVFNTGAGFVNSGNATNTFVSSRNIVAPTPDSTPEIQVQNLKLVTTGGSIGTSAAPLEFNATRLDGQTTANAHAGGSAYLTDTTNGLQVGQFGAGTGDVVLKSLGNVSGNGLNLTAVNPNDGTPEIIGNNVTLDTTAAVANGSTGQIGSPGQFFEVQANVLNAATNDSDAYLAAVGGGTTQVGTIDVGTGTANIKLTGGGSLVSNNVDGTADVVASTVNLTAPNGGDLGTSGNALEIDATTLSASVTGNGTIDVTDTAGGLTVQNATISGTGDITLRANGAAADLNLGSGTASPVVSTNSGTVSLAATDSVLNTATGGATDVAGTSLAISAGTGIGTSGTPLKTAVSNLAANTTTGGVFVTNAGALTVASITGTLGTINGITAGATTGTAIGLTADSVNLNGPLTTGGGAVQVNLTNAGGTVSVGSGFSLSGVSSAAITGGTGSDALSVDLQNATGGSLAITGPNAGTFTLPSGEMLVYTSIESVNATNGQYDLSLNLGTGTNGLNLGDGDMVHPDITRVATSAGVLSITFQAGTAGTPTEQALFSGDASAISSVSITGSDDPDTFRLDLRNNIIPSYDFDGGMPATYPGDALLLNTAGVGGVTFTPGMDASSGTYNIASQGAVVTFSNIERRAVDNKRYAAGSTFGDAVAVFDGNAASPTITFPPYADLGYRGGVSVAVGDVNGDGILDIITATTRGSLVRVFDGVTFLPITQDQFVAFPGYSGGVTVAAGDIDGDGKAEIIVGALTVPGVAVKNFATGTKATFGAFPGYRAGVTVAAGDIDADGKAEVIVGTLGFAHVFRTYEGEQFANTQGAVSPTITQTVTVPGFAGGIFVGSGDLDGDGRAEVLVGGLNVGASLTNRGKGAVAVYTPDITGQLSQQTIVTTTAPGRLPVTAADYDGDGFEDLVFSSGPTIYIYNGLTFSSAATVTPFPGFQGGVFVG